MKKIILTCFLAVSCVQNLAPAPRIMLGAVIDLRKPVILDWLQQLEKATDANSVRLDYYFVTVGEPASSLLMGFMKLHRNCEIFSLPIKKLSFTDRQMELDAERRARNAILKKAADGGYEYMFLISQEIFINPDTIRRLIARQKDVVGEICWKNVNNRLIPNAWMHDDCMRFEKEIDEKVTPHEISHRSNKFIQQLRIPGLYNVGGISDCLLISRRAICAGINFDEIYNLTFKSIDAHFCLRVAALDFDIFLDTTCPGFMRR